VAVLSLQMAFFRDLVYHYDNKLLNKYVELNEALKSQQATEEELMTSNEELTSSNEQMYELTRRLETVLQQKSTELDSYIEAINVNMFSAMTDNNGLFVMVNEPLIAVSGYSREELIGSHYKILSSKNGYAKGVNEDGVSVIKSGKTWRGEVEYKAKDGSSFWFDCVVIPIKGEKESIKYFLSIGLPITERKQSEKMRERTQAVLETITFKTSHNIRGSLARMVGLANLVQKEHIDKEEFKWVAEQLAISSREIDKITSELVDFVNTHQLDIRDNKIEKDKLES
jgi:PAS domain S-box-containing protein